MLAHRAVHRPARGHVGDGQGEAELTEAVPALVADEVDLGKARTSVIPLRPGADRDLGLEQRPRLGVAVTTEGGEDLGTFKAAVDGRRAHLYEQLRLGVAELELTISPQQRPRTTSIGARRLPAGARATRQHSSRAETTSAE